MTLADPLLELTKSQTLFRGSREDLETLKTTFDRQHWLRLPQFVAPDLLRRIQNDLAAGEFRAKVHEGIGRELVTGPDGAFSLVTFLVNDPRLFELVGHITGCRDIQCFTGRIYRMNPGSEHYDSWHDDVEGHRLIAMSLNLATMPHEGGVLQIRERASRRILQEVTNTTYGDAIIFRISRELQHRVTAVDGAVARTAFAGWFRSRPSFRDLISGKHAEMFEED